MRRINLLPADERGRPADRLRSGVVGILLVVGAFVLILMVGVYLVLLLRLGDLEDQVAKLDAEIARQNAHLAELSPTGISRRASKPRSRSPTASFAAASPGISSCRAWPSSCRRARPSTPLPPRPPRSTSTRRSSSPWIHRARLRLRASRCLATRMWQTSSCAWTTSSISPTRISTLAALRNILTRTGRELRSRLGTGHAGRG